MGLDEAKTFTKEQPAPDLWHFGEGAAGVSHVDAYLVLGSERAALIDTLESEQPVSLVAQVRQITALAVDVLLTHGHCDHLGAEAVTMAKAEGFTLYLSHADLSIAKRMRGSWCTADVFRDLREGDRFELGGLTLETYRVAGHTPGSMVFLDRQNRRCFTGDAFGVWLQLPDSLPMTVYIEELRRLEATLSGMSNTRFWTGHMGQTPGGYLTAQVVTDMREACEKVVSGEIVGEDVVPPPEFVGSPMAALVAGAKIVRYKTVTGLTYRQENLG